MVDERVKPLTRGELVIEIRRVIEGSGLDMENRIRAVQEVRGSMRREGGVKGFTGPILRPGKGGRGGKKRDVE